MGSFDQVKFLEAGLEAVRTSMDIVRSFQLQQRSMPAARVKQADQTLLTIADKESGEAAQTIMQKAYPEANFNTEDVGDTPGRSSLRIMIDPIDGTKAFANGASTSTVIIGAYDDNIKEIIACIIGEPISGRIWHASKGEKASRTIKSADSEYTRTINTWQEELNPTASTLLDISSGFIRDNRQILTDDQVARLFINLARKSQVMMLGSNGMHQALVANGSDRMAGAITTAIGGPWDVCGVLLVLNAGGSAKAFSMNSNEQLVEKNPLDVMDYDTLVIGNNQATVDCLANCLLGCLSYAP